MKIFDSEYRFCRILWAHEPVKSTELARLCAEELGWSKATTYTVIKRLTERGAVKSERAVVTSLVSQEEVRAAQIEELVDKSFDGSLPAFVAAFACSRRLKPGEAEALRALIDNWED